MLPALEALLFSSARPVKAKDLADVLEATPEAVAEALARLAADADSAARGVRLEEVAGGWRFVTRPEFDALLRKFHDVSERSRLSLAALETLAIIAYRQPITLPEIQEIRGVNSASVLNTLFEKKLITTAGRKSVVGSPFLYRTTPDFLVRFGLKDVEDLPRPEELAEDLAATVGEPPPPAAASRGDLRGRDGRGSGRRGRGPRRGRVRRRGRRRRRRRGGRVLDRRARAGLHRSRRLGSPTRLDHGSRPAPEDPLRGRGSLPAVRRSSGSAKARPGQREDRDPRRLRADPQRDAIRVDGRRIHPRSGRGHVPAPEQAQGIRDDPVRTRPSATR